MFIKKTILSAAVIVLIAASNSFALTGLGFGVRAGYVTGLDTGPIEDWARGLNADASVDDKMTMVGAHLNIGTLPMIDFDVAIEYAWKNFTLYQDFDLKISDLSINATGYYKILPTPLVTPYVGAGLGTHTLTYSLDYTGTATLIMPADPEKATKLGYHGLAGVKLHPPMFPLEFFAQYRYTYINTDESATKYRTILIGATFNLP